MYTLLIKKKQTIEKLRYNIQVSTSLQRCFFLLNFLAQHLPDNSPNSPSTPKIKLEEYSSTTTTRGDILLNINGVVSWYFRMCVAYFHKTVYCALLCIVVLCLLVWIKLIYFLFHLTSLNYFKFSGKIYPTVIKSVTITLSQNLYVLRKEM